MKPLRINFNPFPELQTERLILRRIRKEDINEVFFMRSDKDYLRYIDREPAKDLSEAAEYIQLIDDLIDKNEGITWGITLKNKPQLIGMICFWNLKKEHFRAEIGYGLMPEYHSQNFMNECLKEVIKYGFNTMNLHSIEANVNPENSSSIKLLEKNHFIREAYFKENYFFNNTFLDSAIYSLVSVK